MRTAATTTGAHRCECCPLHASCSWPGGYHYLQSGRGHACHERTRPLPAGTWPRQRASSTLSSGWSLGGFATRARWTASAARPSRWNTRMQLLFLSSGCKSCLETRHDGHMVEMSAVRLHRQAPGHSGAAAGRRGKGVPQGHGARGVQDHHRPQAVRAPFASRSSGCEKPDVHACASE